METLLTRLCTCSGTAMPTEKTSYIAKHLEFFSVLMWYLDNLEPSAIDLPFLVIPSSKGYIIPGLPQIKCMCPYPLSIELFHS